MVKCHICPRVVQEELGTPALAFVRAVCDALRLDAAVEEEVAELRHNLLRLTHTREFAPAAAFKVRASACVGFRGPLSMPPTGGMHGWPIICTMIGCVPLRTCGRPPVGRAPVLSCPVLAWSIQYMRGVGRSRQAPQATVVKTVPHSAGLSCCAPAQEPCRSYVLRDVICMYCNHCTDLDLCRDPALQVGRQSM